MDKDRIKGKMDDIKGRVKRQAGEWTDNEKLQGEGAADQLKGKTENLAGRAKDAGRDVMNRAQDEVDRLRGRKDREAESHEHEEPKNKRAA